MKISHTNKFTANSVLLTFFISFIFFALVMPIHSSFASELVNQTSTGGTFFFRDTNNLNNSTVPTISLDKGYYHLGTTAILTINDANANVDLFHNDNITATVSGAPVQLTETGPTSGIFVGQFQVTGPISIKYVPDPSESARARISFSSTPGSLHVSDIVLDADTVQNLCFRPVIEPIDVTLADGATITPGTMLVNMSLANILTNPGDDPSQLIMYYKPVGQSWSQISMPGLNAGNGGTGDVDPNSLTVVSDPSNAGYLGGPIGAGQYVLGFETACGGGFGGGITSAGLVVDVLAGLGSSEHSITPPSFGAGSLHFSDGLTLVQGNNKTKFDISQYNQEIPKQVMMSGQKVNMTFKTYEGYSPTGVIHMGLYFVLPGQDMTTTNSIASIVYENNSPVEITDPNNILSYSSASSGNDGKFQYTQFSFTPTKSYDKMSFLVRAWNEHMYSTDARVYDAVVRPEAPKTLPEGVVMYKDFSDLEATLENEGFYKPQIMAHIHSTADVFNGDQAGTVYWLYDTKDHTVTLVIADNNDNELASAKAILQPAEVEKKGDYTFMTFTSEQLNRWDEDQEQQKMGIESAKAMFMAAENGLLGHRNW